MVSRRNLTKPGWPGLAVLRLPCPARSGAPARLWPTGRTPRPPPSKGLASLALPATAGPPSLKGPAVPTATIPARVSTMSSEQVVLLNLLLLWKCPLGWPGWPFGQLSGAGAALGGAGPSERLQLTSVQRRATACDSLGWPRLGSLADILQLDYHRRERRPAVRGQRRQRRPARRKSRGDYWRPSGDAMATLVVTPDSRPQAGQGCLVRNPPATSLKVSFDGFPHRPQPAPCPATAPPPSCPTTTQPQTGTMLSVTMATRGGCSGPGRPGRPGWAPSGWVPGCLWPSRPARRNSARY